MPSLRLSKVQMLSAHTLMLARYCAVACMMCLCDSIPESISPHTASVVLQQVADVERPHIDGRQVLRCRLRNQGRQTLWTFLNAKHHLERWQGTEC